MRPIKRLKRQDPTTLNGTELAALSNPPAKPKPRDAKGFTAGLAGLADLAGGGARTDAGLAKFAGFAKHTKQDGRTYIEDIHPKIEGSASEEAGEVPSANSANPWGKPLRQAESGLAGALLRPANFVADAPPVVPATKPPPPWTDDRSWISAIRHAPAEAAKLAVLADWIAAAGGETCGQTVLLPALRPHRERRLAELELRRMCRQLGLEVLEEEV